MSTLIAARRRPGAIAIAVVLAAGLLYIARPQAQAHHQPADKVAVAGSVEEVFKTEDGPVTLLSQTLRTSKTDLILQVSLECSIVTDIKTVGNDDARASGTLQIWIEITDTRTDESTKVPVADGEIGEDRGKVTACHRAYQRTTSGFDENGEGLIEILDDENEEATIETFFRTKSTHGFNWLALNLAPGVYTLELKGVLEQETELGDATAEVAVGKRTLIGIPTKLPHDATIEEG